MTDAKPSDMPYQKLTSVRQDDPISDSLREVAVCMNNFLGPTGATTSPQTTPST